MNDVVVYIHLLIYVRHFRRPDLRGNHEMKRNTGVGDVSPTDGTRISGDFDHTIRARGQIQKTSSPNVFSSVTMAAQTPA